MSLNASEHKQAAIAEIDAGEITLYRLNKATYDAVEYVAHHGKSVVVTRNGERLAQIVPMEMT